MTRMRGVKPDLLRHEGLIDLEASTGLPVRLCFIGLLMCADRCGRFQWKPRTLKAEILPHDNLDFGKVMEALASGDFVRLYQVAGKDYGWIPGFSTHQRVNNKEQRSTLPPHPDEASLHPDKASLDPEKDAALQGESGDFAGLQGKERKGKEGEGERKVKGNEPPPAREPSAPPVTEEEAWLFAKNLPVAPPWTRQMVGHWFADRSFRQWHTSGDNPLPVSADNWRDDLRRAHRWAQEARPRDGQPSNSGTPLRPQKKINAPPVPIEEPAHVADLLAIVRRRTPGFSGTWQDVPAVLRRAVQSEWDDSRPDNDQAHGTAGGKKQPTSP